MAVFDVGVPAAAAASGGSGSLVGFGILLFLGAIVYLFPAIIASSRKHANSTPICLLNIFFGWTVLGWIGALIWSTTANVKKNISREGA